MNQHIASNLFEQWMTLLPAVEESSASCYGETKSTSQKLVGFADLGTAPHSEA